MCNRSNVRRNACVNQRCINNFASPLKWRITDDNDNAGDYFIIPAYARSRGLIKLTSGLSRRAVYASDSFEGAIQRARRVSSRAKDTRVAQHFHRNPDVSRGRRSQRYSLWRERWIHQRQRDSSTMEPLKRVRVYMYTRALPCVRNHRRWQNELKTISLSNSLPRR